jgi:hypothetical protein
VSKKEFLDKIYNELADSLNISETMTDEIIKSYKAVGQYLGNLEEDLDIRVYPQGSLGLGTLVRPISGDEEGDYDVDLVCLLKNGSGLSAQNIKQVIGKRLKESDRYNPMLDDEGKRCWTLKYSNFHMDILPSVPKFNQRTTLMKNSTNIRLTHKEDDDSYSDKFSDPKAYREWFIEQMSTSFVNKREIVARNRQVEIEEVELFDIRTPLQMAIQILKRHRDIMFSGKDHKPISVIITTLAAKSYSGETSLYDTLEGILKNMKRHINFDESGKAIICNPTINAENFADKWEEVPEKKEAFLEWLHAAQRDIIQDPLNFAKGLGYMKNHMREVFGSRVVNQAFEKFDEQNHLDMNQGKLGVSTTGNVVNSTVGNAVSPIKSHTFYGN